MTICTLLQSDVYIVNTVTMYKTAQITAQNITYLIIIHTLEKREIAFWHQT